MMIKIAASPITSRLPGLCVDVANYLCRDAFKAMSFRAPAAVVSLSMIWTQIGCAEIKSFLSTPRDTSSSDTNK